MADCTQALEEVELAVAVAQVARFGDFRLLNRSERRAARGVDLRPAIDGGEAFRICGELRQPPTSEHSEGRLYGYEWSIPCDRCDGSGLVRDTLFVNLRCECTECFGDGFILADGETVFTDLVGDVIDPPDET